MLFTILLWKIFIALPILNGSTVKINEDMFGKMNNILLTTKNYAIEVEETDKRRRIIFSSSLEIDINCQ